ncbi:MAG: hypothetical protein KDK41_17080 [Leptospiraceae bacterium]|nr:hypothetical protein [Leptospiraceae bacterium]
MIFQNALMFANTIGNNKEIIEYSGFILPIKIIGKSSLKKNKAASSRPKDLDDLANL